MDNDSVDPGLVVAEGTINEPIDEKLLWTLVELTGLSIISSGI